MSGRSSKQGGPETKTILEQTKKPMLPMSPQQSTGKDRIKLKDFTELSSNLGKPDLPKVADVKQSELLAPGIIRPIDR